jgi:hypothetical protein
MKLYAFIFMIGLGITQLKAQQPVLTGNSPTEKTRIPKRNKVPSNILKISLLGPLRGEYKLLYERRLKPWISVQAGIGGTTRDQVFERFGSQGFNKHNYPMRGGFTASAGLRFYPVADGWMGGFFISPDVQYRIYRFNATLTQYDANASPSDQNLKLSYSMREYRLLFGHSYDYIFRNVYLEYYVGLVFREINESLPSFQNTDSGAYYTRQTIYRFVPGIALNATLGYSF